MKRRSTLVDVCPAGCRTTVSLLGFLPRLQERGGGAKMVLIVVEAVPVGSKPVAVNDIMRISTDDRYGFGA